MGIEPGPHAELTLQKAPQYRLLDIETGEVWAWDPVLREVIQQPLATLLEEIAALANSKMSDDNPTNPGSPFGV